MANVHNRPATDQAARGFTWAQIERRIERHRHRVRCCGPLSAIRVLQLSGHRIDTESVLESFQGGDPRGVPVHKVLDLCQAYVPGARLVRVPGRQLNRLSIPCILFVNERRHALVLQSWSAQTGRAEIWDPSDLSTKRVPVGRLRDSWGGDAIVFERRPWGAMILGITNALIAAGYLIRRQTLFRFRNPARSDC